MEVSINNINEFEDYLLNKTSSNYNLNNNYILKTDIDWSNIKTILKNPIDFFDGKFNGNGYSIFNFSLKKADSNNVGLFSKTSNAIIKNLKIIVNGEITGISNVSVLVGNAISTSINHCTINGQLTLNSSGPNSGIIAGSLDNCDIELVDIKLTNSTIRGKKTLGAFVGNSVRTNIKDCKIEGKLTIIGSAQSSQELAGFVGYSSFCKIINCKVLNTGAIIGLKNVSGFVSVDFGSEFNNCEMNLNGNLSSFETTNLFCNIALDLDKSKFENCVIGSKTIINGILVNIFNIKKYSNIAGTNFELKVKLNEYSDDILKLVDLKDNIIEKDGIIYNIFDYILTIRQISKLAVINFNILKEEESAKIILGLFKNKWINLNDIQVKLFETLDFDEKKFNNTEFPILVWDDFSKKQRYAALNLGFTKNIWDNKIIQKFYKNPSLINKNSSGCILNFEICIPEMILKLPNYIRDIILIEIKNFIITSTKFSLPNYKNLNFYYRSSDKLLYSIVFSNNFDLQDDICNVDINDDGKVEQVTKFIKLNIDYDNYSFVINYFKNNTNEYKNFAKSIIDKIIEVDFKCDYTIEIIDFDLQMPNLINSKITVSEAHCKVLEDRNNTDSLSNLELKKTLEEYLPDDLHEYPKNIYYNWELSNELQGNKEKSIYSNYAVCIDKVNTFDQFFYHSPYMTLIALIKLNNKYAKQDDVVYIFVKNELRGIGKVKYFKGIPFINTKVSTKNYSEVATFRICDSENSLLFEVPNFSLIIKPGINVGNISNPIVINGKGLIPPDVQIRNESDFGEPIESFYNSFNVLGFVIINYLPAEKGDVVLAYINDELKEKTFVYLKDNVPYVNLNINTNGKEEKVTFKIFQRSTSRLFEVPDLDLIAEPGTSKGTIDVPITIRGVGKVIENFEDYLNFNEENLLSNIKEIEESSDTSEDDDESSSSSSSDSRLSVFSNTKPEEKPVPVQNLDKKLFLDFYQLLRLNNRKKNEEKKKILSTSKSSCGNGGCAASV